MVSASPRRLRHFNQLEHECLMDAALHRLLGQDGDFEAWRLPFVSGNGFAFRNRFDFGRVDGRKLVAHLRGSKRHSNLRFLGVKSEKRGRSPTCPVVFSSTPSLTQSRSYRCNSGHMGD